MTNFDIFNIVNTILRKEINGSALTQDRFNYFLDLSYIEKLENEYKKYEKDQSSTDALINFKKNETINFDVSGEFNLTSLVSKYWHLDNIYYYYNNNYIHADIVNNLQYVNRLSSTLEYPTSEYPIVRVYDNKLKIFPSPYITLTTNKVTNSGATGTTDWVDSNADGAADNWTVDGTTKQIVDSKYGFTGRAQGVNMDQLVIGGSHSGEYYGQIMYSSYNLEAGKKYYVSLEYILAGTNFTGDTTIVFFSLGGFDFDSIENVVQTTEPQKYVGFFENSSSVSTPFIIYGYNTTQNALKFIFVDNIEIYEISSFMDVDIFYLKEKTTPYMDWYYDANDNIQYLTEGEVYTLQTGEKYIDKNDGSVLVSGSIIGTALNDAVNHTKEMEIPDDHKKDVLYGILSKLGVQMTNQLATQYSLSMEAKEQTR